MPQMSPLLWIISIIFTIILLLSISSFLYFLNIPSPQYLQVNSLLSLKPLYFDWLW